MQSLKQTKTSIHRVTLQSIFGHKSTRKSKQQYILIVIFPGLVLLIIDHQRKYPGCATTYAMFNNIIYAVSFIAHTAASLIVNTRKRFFGKKYN